MSRHLPLLLAACGSPAPTKTYSPTSTSSPPTATLGPVDMIPLEPILIIGEPGDGTGQYPHPDGVIMDDQNRVVVFNQDNRRVQVSDLNDASFD